MEKVEKYSDQYWLNRCKLISFFSKVGDEKVLEKKVNDNPFDTHLKDSLFNLKKFIKENTPSIVSEKTFYQIA